MENFSWDTVIRVGLEYGVPLLKAITIYLVGTWLIRKIVNLLIKIMVKREYDPTLQLFLKDVVKWGLIILLLITIVGTLGIETSGMAAALASVGLAIGLALQGSLANFAGGVLILIFKQFKVGDTIEAQGVIGTVQKINILTTEVLTPQNKLAILPNGKVANENIINATTTGILRVDTTIGVGYDSDIAKTKEALREMCLSHELVLKDPAPMIVVAENAASSINIHVRPFTKAEDHWTVYWWVLENTKLTLDKIGVEIPYPHQVEIVKEKK